MFGVLQQILWMAVILFNNLLHSAGDLMENETFSPRIRSFVQRLPSFFELLWRLKHITLRDIARSGPPINGNQPVLMFPTVQNIVVSYYKLYGSMVYVMKLYPKIRKLTDMRTLGPSRQFRRLGL